MVATENIQTRLLTLAKQRNPHLSFADELVEMLHISRDSAYRRMRGETTMALDEIKTICNRYKISLDSLLMPGDDVIPFHHQSAGDDSHGLYNWIKSVDEHLAALQRASGSTIKYLARDIPIFYYFTSPLLAAYKIFFWLKTQLGTDFADSMFTPEIIPKEYITLTSRIADKYMNIDSIEIWGEETVLGTLRHIEYHFACGTFPSAREALSILDCYQKMLQDIHTSAGSGKKSKSTLALYRNDLMMMDNTIFIETGNSKVTWLQNSSLEWLSTTSEPYCEQTAKRITNTVSKSELITVSGERERNIFFNQVYARIEQTRERIKTMATGSSKSIA
jgi:hypothetical protein